MQYFGQVHALTLIKIQNKWRCCPLMAKFYITSLKYTLLQKRASRHFLDDEANDT